MHTPKILIIEDEAKIRDVLRAYLVREGFTVEESGDGEKGLALFRDGQHDMIILDLMLPGMPGEKVAAAVRQVGDTPILMLTAKSEEWERLRGFDLGVDDYVTKPFSPKEVVARIKAILKRAGKGLPDDLPPVEFDGLTINPATREVFVGGEEKVLTATEFDILYEMARMPGRVFRRTQLASLVLGYDHDAYDRTIDSHIKNLRKKLGTLCECVQTVYGVGYKFHKPGDN